MEIREAKVNDAEKITTFLNQLGYARDTDNLKERINYLIHHPDHELVVAVDHDPVAVMSVHFVPQLRMEGDFAIISYFSVDEKYRSMGVGKQLEKYCVEQSKNRCCERVQVHCIIRRNEARRFYERQGYIKSRKYFTKDLV